jgi:MFS transporter, YQGE family, putative transporter
MVSGVFTTFLITLMTYKVAGGELNLGLYNTGAQIMSLFAFYALAKFSTSNDRITIFAIGSVMLVVSSMVISIFPVFISLIIFGVFSPIAMNMINTSMNAMIYQAIEKDVHYRQKRLDYIIIREIPLGVGRIIGVFLFLTMKNYFNLEELLPISFSLFPIVYVIMIPALYVIWIKPRVRKRVKTS